VGGRQNAIRAINPLLMVTDLGGPIKAGAQIPGAAGASDAFAGSRQMDRIGKRMSSENLDRNDPLGQSGLPEPDELVLAVAVADPPLAEVPAPRLIRRRVGVPVALFIATCLSTLLIGGWTYAVGLMTILICHEAGHFLQARRYGVYASLPYFLPMPIPPIGTIGAVIGMRANMGNRRALFDIGITGPLAGLVPTLIFCIVGLQLSELVSMPAGGGGGSLGLPILFRVLAALMFEPPAAGQILSLHAMAYAGWVGLLITSLNLIPIGQLDGGHILYALLRGRAHRVASVLLLAAAAAVLAFGLWGWTLMLILLTLMGPKHPPTADDHVPLGIVRTMLGWAALAFVLIGFTPTPFLF